MLVEPNTLIPTAVHTHDNDTSHAECKPVVESTVTIFSYPPSNQFLESFIMIHWEVSNFSSFSECLEICPESSIPITKLVAPLS